MEKSVEFSFHPYMKKEDMRWVRQQMAVAGMYLQRIGEWHSHDFTIIIDLDCTRRY